MFEYLGTLQMNQLNPEINQWNHQYSLLLANQPGVPQATPAPGFEHRLLMAAAQGQLLEQQISASTMSGTIERFDNVGNEFFYSRHTRNITLTSKQNWKLSFHALSLASTACCF